MKRTLTGIAVIASLAGSIGLAQAQQQPASPHTITANVGLFSQYVFRGLTQTNGEPAVQGGFDYSHSSGFYAGTWASNISWLRDGGAYRAGGSAEIDLYGGFKGSIGKTDLSYDLGTLYYWYPGDAAFTPVGAAASNPKADTWEIYGALTYKWVTGKVSYAVSDKVFGVNDASGTYYLDLTANVPITKEFSLIAHYGMQRYTGQDPRFTPFSNDTLFSYNDWKIGLSYALPKDFTIGAYYTDTGSADVRGYGSTTECVGAVCGTFPKNISKGTGTVFISKTF